MSAKPFRVGLAGLGTVGAEVAKRLISDSQNLTAQAGRPIELVAYSVRDSAKDRGVDLSKAAYVGSPLRLAARDDVDAVVELVGGASGAALDAAQATLKNGKHLVTGNKAMLAAHWQDLFNLADQNDVQIMFEASVCGGVPVIKVLREGLAGNSIVKISGILNGTCNYILSSMETSGVEFADALLQAQNLGYAEKEDPSLDIDGWDTAHKLVVLAKLAFDPALSLDDIKVQGIREITLKDVRAAREKGQAIRLIATVEKQGGKPVMSVAPQYLPLDHPLAHVGGAMNAVTIDAQPVQTCTLIGPGAGGGPTASAVLADIIDLARL